MKKFLLYAVAFCLLCYWCSDEDNTASTNDYSDEQMATSSSASYEISHPQRSSLESITFDSQNDVWNYLCNHKFYSTSGTEMAFSYGKIYNAGQLISNSVNVEIVNDKSAILHFTSHLFNGRFKIGVMVLDNSHFVLDADNKIPYYEK